MIQYANLWFIEYWLGVKMKPTAITVDDVIRFAEEHATAQLTTLKQSRPFTIRPDKTGIRYTLPNGSNWLIDGDLIQEYVDTYNASSTEDRTKTTIYRKKLRERSYMVSILFEIGRKRQSSARDETDGLNDLDAPAGNDTPDRAWRSSLTVIRDQRVRNHVIREADGRCEYCGQEGFLMPGGRRYLEAHHIIALAHQGKDTPENVIALCPGHHREAHYGAEAEALEREFLLCIQNRK